MVDLGALLSAGETTSTNGWVLADDLGELSELVSSTGYGTDVHVAVINFTCTSVGDSGYCLYIISQDCDEYTSWYVGSFMTEVSFFAKVLDYSGSDNQLATMFQNRGAGATIYASSLGDGWKHYYDAEAGFGGCEQSYSYQYAAGDSMTIALALPYEGFGDHGGVAVWAGAVPYHDDDIEYEMGFYDLEDRVAALEEDG